MAEKKEENTAGKDDNLMAAISYLLGFITGLIVYVVYKEKKNKFVLFHAMQSTIFSVIYTVIMIPVSIVLILLSFTGIGCIISVILLVPITLISLAIMLFLMYKAYSGEKFMIPVVGAMAEKYST